MLVAMADHAAIAVQSTQEAEQAARHRSALEQLLQVSSRLTETFAIDEILHVRLRRHPHGARLRERLHRPARTRHGRLPDAGHVRVGHRRPGREHRDDVRADRAPARPAVRGRGLLPARPRAGPRAGRARAPHLQSTRSGRGPLAWRNHWLDRPALEPHRRRHGRRSGPTTRPTGSSRPSESSRRCASSPTRRRPRSTPPPSTRRCSSSPSTIRSPGCFNRRAFNERLEQEVSRSVRYGHPMALVLCDLNGFKALNDRNGHAAGDEALQVVGGVLTSVLRTADAAFRIGGDEFALILPETGEDEARAAVDRVGDGDGGGVRRARRGAARPASASRSARATATIRGRSSAPPTARCTRRSRACLARRDAGRGI